MKNRRNYLFIIAILVLSSLLSSCVGAGATATTNNFAGLTIDPVTGMAYLANGQFVHALNLQDIREVKDDKTGLVTSREPAETWRYPTEAQKNVIFTAPPAASDDGQLLVGGYDHKFYSLEKATGAQKWVNTDASNRYYAEAALLDGKIFATNIDNFLYTLDLNGLLQWKFEGQDAFWSKPANDGKTLFVGGMDHFLYALNPNTGQVLWQTEGLGGAMVGNPVLDAGGVLYIGTLGSEMIAIDTKANGKILWRLPVAGWVYSSPALQDGRLYFGDLEGFFYVVDAATGKVIWQIQPDTGKDRAIIGTPLVFGDSVYFGIKAGKLYSFDAALDTADPLWDQPVELDGKLYAPIQAYNDTIVVTLTGTGPNLVGLDQTGKQLWIYQAAKK